MSEDTKPAETTEAKTDKKTRGPAKPLQGKFEIEFLKDAAVPERKPLHNAGGVRDTVMSQTLKALKEHAGQLAVVFTSPDREEVFTRRASLIQCADRLGIALDEKNTASRAFVKDGQPVMAEDGKTQLYALYARVHTAEEVAAKGGQG